RRYEGVGEARAVSLRAALRIYGGGTMRFGATVAAVVAMVVLAAVLVWPRAEAGRAGHASRSPVATASPVASLSPAPSRSPAPSPSRPAATGALVDAEDFTGTVIDRGKW